MVERRGFGVALGGGTARAIAHIGALKALERAGTPPTVLAGTSYGALIAALYALGVPALELEHRMRRQNTLEVWAQGLDFGLHRASLIHGRRLERWLDRKIFFGASFADTELPLAIACTDLASGRLVILREGSIARAVRASCALPGLFAPVVDDGRALVDGGFVEAVPFTALAALGPELMLGLHAGIDVEASRFVAVLRRTLASPRLSLWRRVARAVGTETAVARTLTGLARAAASYRGPQRVPADALLVHIDPPVAWWDFHKSPEAIAAGERALQSALATPAFAVRLDPHRRTPS